MSTTKYQVLYRYINEATNTAITNDISINYQPVHEIYADPGHKLFSADESLQIEAMEEQQQLIADGNSSSNDKASMLFAYNGTEKINHNVWISPEPGYIVRDWKLLRRKLIGNRGDFSKDFTTLEAETPELGGTVVCNGEVLKKYFPTTIFIADSNDKADAGTKENPYYTWNKINKLIEEATIFEITSPTLIPSKTKNMAVSYYETRKYYIGPVAIGKNHMQLYKGYYSGTSVFGQETNDDNLFAEIQVTKQNINTIEIPGHYKESSKAPYLIIDTYKKIELSPWFVSSTCGSLESAISKAKILIDSIGLENVKVIKLVPFDQFIKIK